MSAAAPFARLSRGALAAAGTPMPAPPVRIVHLGVGAFHRAHQAWYTDRADRDAPPGARWGIAAFTGRSPHVAEILGAQDGVYTVVERGPEHDQHTLVGSIAEVHPAHDTARLLDLFAAPATALVTLTVTEAGYHLTPDGALDFGDPAVAADVAALSGRTARHGLTTLRDGTALRTPIARLTAGLAHRWRSGGGPIAVVPCDNLPANGERLRAAVRDLAAAAGLPAVADQASFVSTSVDRITPHTADLSHVAAAIGFCDAAAVATEPFSDWTLTGEFPAGRPDWEVAGARFTDDLAPFEQRKLLLLNGGHLVLAFCGLLRGLVTIAEAVADSECRHALAAFWDEAARALPPVAEADAYRADLLHRFANPRIAHRLDQIAVDTVTKLRLRVLPVLIAERAAGRDGSAALAVIGAWQAALRSGAVPDRSTDPDVGLARLLSGIADADALRVRIEAAGRDGAEVVR